MKELKNGKSKIVIESNVKMLQENGFTEDEALQIAHSKAKVKLTKKVYRTHQFERACRNSTRRYLESLSS